MSDSAEISLVWVGSLLGLYMAFPVMDHRLDKTLHWSLNVHPRLIDSPTACLKSSLWAVRLAYLRNHVISKIEKYLERLEIAFFSDSCLGRGRDNNGMPLPRFLF